MSTNDPSAADTLSKRSLRQLIDRPISDLQPYANNARTHSKKQIAQIAESITRFGFTNPVLIGDDNEIIAGHGRIAAAKLLGLKTVPTLTLSDLSAQDRRAYILADNKLATNAGWDQQLLAIELQGLIDVSYDLSVTGFSLAEIDLTLDASVASDPVARDEPEDQMPPHSDLIVSQLGDLWQLGRHRLLCGDARLPDSYTTLLGSERVDLVFTDPPYNRSPSRDLSHGGRIKHADFAFASGEMTEEAFTEFLTDCLCAASDTMRDGAIAYVCMDWRGMGPLLAAGKKAFTEMKNLVVWNKTNGGQSAFYRSKHELIFVFKQGAAPHTNSFGLGAGGRYRTNVWDCAGVNTFSATRDEELASHPTCKPVSLVADAIRDCSKRGELVLDAFGGAGSTLIAADKTGRTARLIEYDPRYCDTIIRRWEMLTGKRATLAGSGTAFEDIAAQRALELAA